MKTTVLISVVVALAVADEQGSYGGNAASPGPVPESVKQLGKDVAKYQGCLWQRLWSDLKNVYCGSCQDGAQGDLVECVCKNQDKVTHLVRVNSNICLPQNSQNSAIIREINDEVEGLGIAALCGAYEEGNGNDGGYKPEPKPY